MIKIIFFDFSRTVGKDSGFGAGPALMRRKNYYEKLYIKYKSHQITEEEYIKSVVTLWKDVREKDLQEIYYKIRLNPNIKETLRILKKMEIKTGFNKQHAFKIGRIIQADWF